MVDVASTDPTGRYETVHGSRTYAEVNDLLAQPLGELVDGVQAGLFDGRELSVDLLRQFHHSFVSPVLPDMAGVWRRGPVTVGNHEPPDWGLVDSLMRIAMSNLNARIEYADTPDLQVEALAFAEASMLNIHPFMDFNGRAIRVFALEIVRRFDLPLARTWVEDGTPESKDYAVALAVYDNSVAAGGMALKPMCDFWLRYRLAV